jgi:hypothetical protein
MSNIPSPEEWNASVSRIAEIDAAASGLGPGWSGPSGAAGRPERNSFIALSAPSLQTMRCEFLRKNVANQTQVPPAPDQRMHEPQRQGR